MEDIVLNKSYCIYFCLLTTSFVGCLGAVARRLGINNQLFEAAKKFDYDDAKRAIDFGADVNAKDDGGWTVLGRAIGSRDDCLPVVKLLIEKKADVNLTSNEGQSPLHIAVLHDTWSERSKVGQLLIKSKANLEVKQPGVGYDGATPLLLAASNRRHEITKLLLDNCAKVDNPTKDGCTPLFAAAISSCVNSISYLLANLANIDIKYDNKCLSDYSSNYKVIQDMFKEESARRKELKAALSLQFPNDLSKMILEYINS